MSGHFDTEFFRGNRARLTTLFAGTAPIVLSANGQLQRNGSLAYKFKQDSSFWYYAGLNVADLTLVIDKGREYLILPDGYDDKVRYDGADGRRALATASGIREVLSYKDGWKKLATRLKKVKHIATIAPPPAYVRQEGFHANPSRVRLLERIKSFNPDLEILDLRPQVLHMRVIKQPSELEALQEAINITVESIKKLRRRGWGAFGSEYDIETELTRYFRLAGADDATFIVAAAGKHSTTIHHLPNRNKLPKVGSIVLDVGAEVQGYTSDISRTYLLGGPKRQYAKIYEAVLDVRQYALSKLMPGITIRRYENDIVLYMGEKLRELGLIKTVTPENVRRFYPHITSHYLGLDVHDAGDYDQPLAPNMVVTVEPGIYIPGQSIGVRIEDDVLIMAEGPKVLSDSLPITLS